MMIRGMPAGSAPAPAGSRKAQRSSRGPASTRCTHLVYSLTDDLTLLPSMPAITEMMKRQPLINYALTSAPG
jgi:hypothetical protein